MRVTPLHELGHRGSRADEVRTEEGGGLHVVSDSTGFSGTFIYLLDTRCHFRTLSLEHVPRGVLIRLFATVAKVGGVRVIDCKATGCCWGLVIVGSGVTLIDWEATGCGWGLSSSSDSI